MRLNILLIWVCFYAQAQIPAYYNSIDFTQEGTLLENQLTNLMNDTHTTELEYTPEVWTVLKLSDLDPENINGTNVLLLYGYDDEDDEAITDRLREDSLSCHTSSCLGKWNREHIFPRSLGTPNLGFEGTGADAYNLRAADSSMNNRRSNRPYAGGSGHSTITANGSFYPGDEWKGDVARTIMYMKVHYPTQCDANAVGDGENIIDISMPDIFLQWNCEDPPSALEMNRNDIISFYQGNRNPFVDNAYLATKIWGGCPATNTWTELKVEEPIAPEYTLQIYPNPATDFIQIKSAFLIEQVVVFNVQKQEILRTKFDKLDVSQLPAGVYFINVRGINGEKSIKKFLKK